MQKAESGITSVGVTPVNAMMLYDLDPDMTRMICEGRCRIYAAVQTPAAIGSRRYRERQRQGVRLIEVEVSPEMIETLVEQRIIGPEDTESRDALAFALGQILEEFLQEIKVTRDGVNQDGAI
jgi:hypothetical protein